MTSANSNAIRNRCSGESIRTSSNLRLPKYSLTALALRRVPGFNVESEGVMVELYTGLSKVGRVNPYSYLERWKRFELCHYHIGSPKDVSLLNTSPQSLRRNTMLPTKGYAAMEAGATLQPFSFQRRSVGPKDVLLDIQYCGICHSDIHQARGRVGRSHLSDGPWP